MIHHAIYYMFDRSARNVFVDIKASLLIFIKKYFYGIDVKWLKESEITDIMSVSIGSLSLWIHKSRLQNN